MDGELDWARFEGMVEQGRALLVAGETARAAVEPSADLQRVHQTVLRGLYRDQADQPTPTTKIR